MGANQELEQIAQEVRAEEGAMAAQVEQGAGQGEGGQQADPAQEWRDAVELGCCEIVFPAVPELEAAWSPDRRERLGNALAACAERYGWTVAGLFGHPLLHLAVAAWPMGAALVVVAKERAKAKAMETQAAGAGAQQ